MQAHCLEWMKGVDSASVRALGKSWLICLVVCNVNCRVVGRRAICLHDALDG